jgi:hypothetical protein
MQIRDIARRESRFSQDVALGPKFLPGVFYFA